MTIRSKVARMGLPRGCALPADTEARQVRFGSPYRPRSARHVVRGGLCTLAADGHPTLIAGIGLRVRADLRGPQPMPAPPAAEPLATATPPPPAPALVAPPPPAAPLQAEPLPAAQLLASLFKALAVSTLPASPERGSPAESPPTSVASLCLSSVHSDATLNQFAEMIPTGVVPTEATCEATAASLQEHTSR